MDVVSDYVITTTITRFNRDPHFQRVMGLIADTALPTNPVLQ